MTQFTQAKLKHIDTILELMPHYYEHDHLVFDRHRAEKALHLFLSQNTYGQIWVIEKDSKPVGYMTVTVGFSFECHGREAFVDELFIMPKMRGQGIGSEAIRHAIRYCKEQSIQLLRLEVTKTNPDAQKLYLRLGFQDWGRSLLAYPLVTEQ